jgi:hypothetical protein
MKYSYLVPDIDNVLNRGKSQVVSPVPLTAEVHVLFQARPFGICDEKSGTATD